MSELTVGTISGLAANSYVIDVASGSQLTQPGMILQVVSTTKTDTFTTTSGTFVDITGLSATITPRFTSSKIYVSFDIFASANGGFNAAQFLLLRDSTAIGIGDAAGSRTRMTAGLYTGDSAGANSQTTVSASLLDSPNTTSSTTYKLQTRASNPGQTTAINRGTLDTDVASAPRTISTITLIEVAG